MLPSCFRSMETDGMPAHDLYEHSCPPVHVRHGVIVQLLCLTLRKMSWKAFHQASTSQLRSMILLRTPLAIQNPCRHCRGSPLDSVSTTTLARRRVFA